jgi:NhaP-type Na+/H+ or K+/H+ antiporter
VLLPALVLASPLDDGAAIAGEVATQIGLAAACGLAIGWLTARLVDDLVAHEEVSAGFLLVSALAMGLLALGAVHALGGSGVLASFIAGVTFSLAVGERYAEELEQVQSALERLLIVPVFLLFGSLLPWDGWAALGWSGVAFALWVLLLRRPGPAALALAPTRTPRRGVAFLGWYGPLGVAAIYYATFVDRYGFAEYERIFAACALAIAASVAGHTLTATPGVRRYAGRRATTTLRHPLRKGIDEAP